MHTLLITAVLLAIAATVYLALVVRQEAAAAGCGWRALYDPRPGAGPRRLRIYAGALWVAVVLGLGALALLGAQS